MAVTEVSRKDLVSLSSWCQRPSGACARAVARYWKRLARPYIEDQPACY